MSFIWPVLLILLLLVPLCILLYLRMLRRRQYLAARYGSLGMVQAAAGRPLGRRRHIPPVLFLAGLTILLIGLARPQTLLSMPRGTHVSGLESDGGDLFFCGGARTGKVRTVRRPK